jgi:hypothetical protein
MPDLRYLIAMALLTLSLLLPFPHGYLAEERWSDGTTEPIPLTHARAGDLATALSGWPPRRNLAASFALREARPGSVVIPAYLLPASAAAWLILLVAMLIPCSRRRAVIGLRWSRSPRGPPAGLATR